MSNKASLLLLRFLTSIPLRLGSLSQQKTHLCRQTKVRFLNDDKNDDDNDDHSGTMIVDATCAPSHIRYPQDVSLLNEAGENAEKLVDLLHDPYEKFDILLYFGGEI